MVDVVASNGRWQRRVGPREAFRLLAAGHSIRQVRQGRIGAVQLSACTHQPVGTPSRGFDRGGQRYTYVEQLKDGQDVVARCVQFKHIDEADRPLFMLAVTDCMARQELRVAIVSGIENKGVSGSL